MEPNNVQWSYHKKCNFLYVGVNVESSGNPTSPHDRMKFLVFHDGGDGAEQVVSSLCEKLERLNINMTQLLAGFHFQKIDRFRLLVPDSTYNELKRWLKLQNK